MQIPVKVAEGTHLDKMGRFYVIDREEYGDDENNKPNEYCVWQNVSFNTYPKYAWVETDEHYRNKLVAQIEKLKSLTIY